MSLDRPATSRIMTDEFNLTRYDPRGPVFTKKVQAAQGRIQKLVDAHFSADIRRIHSILNSLYRRQGCYMWLNNLALCLDCRQPTYRLALTAFHKGLIALASAMRLVGSGLTGGSYSQIRYAFEAVVTAKYCGHFGDDPLASGWLEGKDLYFTNAVLKKIPEKFGLTLRQYWDEVSKVSHFTISSGQLVLSTEVGPDVHGPTFESSLVHIEKLLHLYAHLQRRYLVTASVRYYTSRYNKGLARIDRSEHEKLRKILSESSQRLVHEDRQFIRCFAAAWK